MQIEYIQKLTLLDYPGKVACTVFLHGCNLRCPFCHNPALVTRPPENCDTDGEAELFAYLNKRRGVLDGVCVTGGEPLLSDDIIPLLEKIRGLGYSVKLDTNGTNPDRLIRIVRAGLCDYVAVDIKNCGERYAETTGLKSIDLEAVKKTIAFLLSDEVDYEFRTTVVRELHSEKDVFGAAELISGAKRYFLQAFRDTGDLVGGTFTSYSPDEMKNLCENVKKIIPNTFLRGV